MRRVILFAGLIFLFFSLPAQGIWQEEINQQLKHSDLNAALVAIQIKSLDGKVIYENNSNVGVMPASTLKSVTTLGALGIMGSDYRYETKVGYQGELSNDGTLYGDLIIIGSGDPSFGSDQDDEAISLDDRLDDMAEAITNSVSCLEGKLIVNATIFDDEAVHPGWAWDDLSNYYAAGIWGVNIHENLYHLPFTRNSIPGSATSIGKLTPEVVGLQLENKVTVGPKGSYDEAYIYGDPNELKKQIRGTIPPGKSDFRIKGAIPDSRIWFAQLLKSRLLTKGLAINEIEISDHPIREIRKIESFYSNSLRDLVQHANEKSDNLYCDVFLKSVGAKYDKIGSWASGQEALLSYFQESNISTIGYHQEDGSGLTMRNRVSASFMTDFLIHHINELGIDELKYLLPKAGVNGSVRNFLNGYDVQSHAWLKSGSINAVVAYTGFIEFAPNQYVTIYIASNGHTKSNRSIRGHIERIIETAYQGLSLSKG